MGYLLLSVCLSVCLSAENLPRNSVPWFLLDLTKTDILVLFTNLVSHYTLHLYGSQHSSFIWQFWTNCENTLSERVIKMRQYLLKLCWVQVLTHRVSMVMRHSQCLYGHETFTVDRQRLIVTYWVFGKIEPKLTSLVQNVLRTTECREILSSKAVTRGLFWVLKHPRNYFNFCS